MAMGIALAFIYGVLGTASNVPVGASNLVFVGTPPPSTDVDNNGQVDADDLVIVAQNLGLRPAPMLGRMLTAMEGWTYSTRPWWVSTLTS